MPVRALVAAGRSFGIAENSIRVALTRLHAAGTVERDERGRYRLGARAEATAPAPTAKSASSAERCPLMASAAAALAAFRKRP